MRLLFVDSCPEYLGRRLSRRKMHPMLGLAYVASYAKARGHEVRVLDMEMSPKTGRDLDGELADFMPDMIGVTSTIPFAHAAFQVFKRAKEAVPGCVTVLGGGAPSMVAPSELFARCSSLDHVVMGEGEKAFAELAERVAQRADAGTDTVPGVASAHGRPQMAPADLAGDHQDRPTIRKPMPAAELDELPFPDWSMYPVEHYQRVYSFRFHRLARSMPILYARGCPYTCTFCSSAYGRTFRARTPGNVVREMTRAKRDHDITVFDFLDPVATANKPRFMQLCTEIRTSEIGGVVSFNIETRADLVNREVLGAAAAAGCECILFGLESASQSVLDSLKKGTSLQQYRDAFAMASDVGIHPRATIILGTPEETLTSVEETEEFVAEMQAMYNVEVEPYFLALYPGTEMHDKVDQGVNGVRWKPSLRGDWSKARREKPMITLPSLPESRLLQCMENLQRLRRQSLRRVSPLTLYDDDEPGGRSAWATLPEPIAAVGTAAV